MKINLIKTQKALSVTQIGLAGFVINPYRGCEFGCRYCYSQENKNIKKKKEEWGKFLDVKVDLDARLKEELRHIRPERVLLGSTTECFQPKEKKFKITENILKILKELNIPLIILTKSSLIEEYINLINYNPDNKIYFTFMFSNSKIKNLLEQETPSLKKRIKTTQRLMENNIKVKVHLGPFIPYTEDLEVLFGLLPPKIEEVEIEVYNSKMGNFQKVFKLIKEEIEARDAKALAGVYSSRQNYSEFCGRLINQANRINEKYGFKLNFIVPEFDSWYTDKIKYE